MGHGLWPLIAGVNGCESIEIYIQYDNTFMWDTILAKGHLGLNLVNQYDRLKLREGGHFKVAG